MLALRSLGLGLESIAVCLDAGVDPARLVRDHLPEVEAVAAELDRRRVKLRRLVEALDAGRVPDTAALLDAVRASTASPEVLGRHLDSDQVAALRARAEALGPVAHYLLDVEWPELYRRAERHRVAGIPPDDPRVQRRRPTAGGTSAGTWTWPDSGGTTRRNMPDKPPAPRIPVAVASAAVLLLCTLVYAVVAALGDAPWGVVPALLVATAVYGVLAWYRQRRVGRQH